MTGMFRRFIGLLLMLITAAIAAVLIFSNLTGPRHQVSFAGQYVNMTLLALLCTGLALGLLFSLGLATLLKARRRRHRDARGSRDRDGGGRRFRRDDRAHRRGDEGAYQRGDEGTYRRDEGTY
ncbi:hypothetical protein NGF19_16040 [Streptomyces sp. RY43-2]|uniref:Lipopolysaccharide assembly protein A domain-containing protein n=1 Tax=Streptomyces macrolidinus TaxID=2952607 RepID=A0ABT0ZFC2_9ACTN|nr:hypothetical protein [Streptomyces macrolidinus]MCN9242285.1 hypothetical protein [Streptomyces macrolidinus]